MDILVPTRADRFGPPSRHLPVWMRSGMEHFHPTPDLVGLEPGSVQLTTSWLGHRSEIGSGGPRGAHGPLRWCHTHRQSPNCVDTTDDVSRMAAATRGSRLIMSIMSRLSLKQFARFSSERYVHGQVFSALPLRGVGSRLYVVLYCQ